jgi:hypothetical protein
MAEQEQSTPPADDVGQAEVTEAVKEANAKGYYGVVTDETPNENYTVAGVLAGKPTPETESRGERRAIPDADAPTRERASAPPVAPQPEEGTPPPASE